MSCITYIVKYYYMASHREYVLGDLQRTRDDKKQIIGKGAFGQVAKATAVNLQGRAKKMLVAVKMLKGTKK